MNKYRYLRISSFAFISIVLTSCFQDNQVEAPIIPVSLTIIVDDGNAMPVSGAVVELFNTADDYISEVNAIASGQTDAIGGVTFDAAVLGSTPTKFYFNIAKGTQRNWNFVSSTAVMNLTNGATVVETSIGDLPPGFVYLTNNAFLLKEYSYTGSPFVLEDNWLPDCEINDIIEFKKDGSVWRSDETNNCDPPSEFQLPLYNVDGTAWSTWGLNSDGSEINIRDFDPYWDSGNIEVTGGILIDESLGSLIIAYGGPYNALFVKM